MGPFQHWLNNTVWKGFSNRRPLIFERKKGIPILLHHNWKRLIRYKTNVPIMLKSTVSWYVSILLNYSLYSQHSNVMYRLLLLSTCIYPENDRSDTLCRTIIDTIKEKALLLEKWKKFHEDQFGPDTHNIPNSLELCLSKMSHGGSMITNTCNY